MPVCVCVCVWCNDACLQMLKAVGISCEDKVNIYICLVNMPTWQIQVTIIKVVSKIRLRKYFKYY